MRLIFNPAYAIISVYNKLRELIPNARNFNDCT